MRALRVVATLLGLLLPSMAWAQATVLQAGPWAPGHVPVYVGNGSSQPVVMDGGPAAGGGVGIGASELGLVSPGTGTPPYANGGTGPFGTNVCDYDAPITNATGYHYLCFGPNADGGGMIAYGAAGSVTQLPLTININGTPFTFPGAGTGDVAGPGSSTVGDLAVWNNTAGTLLKDVGINSTLQFDGSGKLGIDLATPNPWTGLQTFSGNAEIIGDTTYFYPKTSTTGQTIVFDDNLNTSTGSAGVGLNVNVKNSSGIDETMAYINPGCSTCGPTGSEIGDIDFAVYYGAGSVQQILAERAGATPIFGPGTDNLFALGIRGFGWASLAVHGAYIDDPTNPFIVINASTATNPASLIFEDGSSATFQLQNSYSGGDLFVLYDFAKSGDDFIQLANSSMTLQPTGSIFLSPGSGSIVESTKQFSDTDVTASTSTSTGAIVDAGGLGVAKNTVLGGAYVSAGSVPTATGAGGTCAGAATGGAVAGVITLTGACAATNTITLSVMPTAPTGYSCDAVDRTQPATLAQETSTSATTAVLTVAGTTSGATDVIQFKCLAY